jgi:oligosaccharide repeat unit polymerase
MTPPKSADTHGDLLPQCVFFGSSVVGMACYAILPASSGYPALIVFLFTMLASLLAFEWRRVGDPISPVGVLATGGILLFVLRAWTISLTGVTSPGAIADEQPFDSLARQAGSAGLFQVMLFFTFVGVAYFMRVKNSVRDGGHSANSDAVGYSLGRVTLLMYAAIGLAVVLLLYLVGLSGGLASYISGLSVRSSFLSGHYYLTLGYLPLEAVVVYWLVLRERLGLGDRKRVALVVGAISLLVVGGLTGGRGPVVLSGAIPLLFCKQISRRRLSGFLVVVMSAIVGAGALVMGLLLRQNRYDNGESLILLKANPIKTLLDRLTSGAETKPFDSLLRLNEVRGSSDFKLQLGSTYVKTFTWFVPGGILPSKSGGANTWFTKTYLPRFYYPDRIETSISAVGEAVANFSLVGPILVGFVVGSLAGAFDRRNLSRYGVYGVSVCAVLTPLFFSFLRGDSYQNVSTGLILVFLLWFIDLQARPAMRTHPKISPGPTSDSRRSVAEMALLREPAHLSNVRRT